MVSSCRRRRSLLYYVLALFFLVNFCLAILFLKRAVRNDLPLNPSSGQQNNEQQQSDEDDGIRQQNVFQNDAVITKPSNTKDAGVSAFSVFSSLSTNNSFEIFRNNNVPPIPSNTVNVVPSQIVPEELEDIPSSDVRKSKYNLRDLSGNENLALVRLYEQRATHPIFLNWELMENRNVDVVVAVQIHDRLPYLAFLLDSFRKVPSWKNTVIIMSHDFYSPEVEKMVKNCTFAPVRIF